MPYKNKEKEREYQEKYREVHKEQIREYNKKYYQANKEKINEKEKRYNSKYYLKNRDKILKQQHERYLKYREEIAQRRKQRRQKYPEKAREMARKHRDKRDRNLGFNPLNEHFEGSEAHHINFNDVIYIPKEIHQNIRHNLLTGKNMALINSIAYQFLMNNYIIYS